MADTELLNELQNDLGLQVQDKNSGFTIQELADAINKWIVHDFQKLISVLYRMDIDETRLKQLLKQNPETNAGLILAEMMVERYAQKKKSREQNSKKETDFEEEKW